MLDRLALVSYGLVTIAGICFISGLAILSDERGLERGQTGNYTIDIR